MNTYRSSLFLRLILMIGLIMVLSLAILACFHIRIFQPGALGLAIAVFILTAVVVSLFANRFIKRPIRRLIDNTRRIARGEQLSATPASAIYDIGQLDRAVRQMGDEIAEKQDQLNKQRDEYQRLFELVPCIITVQDRDYRLIQYNQEFSRRFDPQPGDHCYHAYKGRDTKCPLCPVEKTFADGRPHYSEETGIARDGSPTHWIVKTAPITDAEGEIVAAMEINMDITHKRQLEERLRKSEQKYQAIFNNIPNPVFVLDAKTLEILDCNESITTVYGYAKEEVRGKSFLTLFEDPQSEPFALDLKSASPDRHVKHLDHQGRRLYVLIRVLPAEFPGSKVFIVTTSDISKRLEMQQQLLQASKLATLGEMSTAVAHELNQPLTVIKTASSFFMKKIGRGEPIAPEVLVSMSTEIDRYVDRAAKIIDHMRQFGRKGDVGVQKIPVNLNRLLERSFEIFGQQLKVRGIEVHWDLAESLPAISADPDQLEQVVINLFVNARDALEERAQNGPQSKQPKTIRVHTRILGANICLEFADNGCGMPAGVHDKIFEPFFTTKEVGRGTGLGLSISYGIVQEHGGTIRVDSLEGQGARFSILFPIPEAP